MQRRLQYAGLGKRRCKNANTGEGKAAAGDQLYGLQRQSRLPAKNLMGIPWRAALALEEAGRILRSDIIWRKPNVQPESVKDRSIGAVLHPFCGSGAAAISAGRRFIGIAISSEYARLARQRISSAPPPLRAAR